MEPTQTTRDIWLRRRSLFGSAALTVAAVQFGVTGIAQGADWRIAHRVAMECSTHVVWRIEASRCRLAQHRLR